MRSGLMRYYVDLQKRVPGAPDAANEPTYAWVSQGFAWAAIEALSMTSMAGAREALGGGTQSAFDMREIAMRPFPGVGPVDWRVVDDNGTTYDIKAARVSPDLSTLTLLALIGGTT